MLMATTVCSSGTRGQLSGQVGAVIYSASAVLVLESASTDQLASSSSTVCQLGRSKLLIP
jgi:hypothetical protein